MDDTLTYLVVLNRHTPGGATNATVLDLDTAKVVARSYWNLADDGDAVQIYIPAHSRDFADYSWTKGKGDGP